MCKIIMEDNKFRGVLLISDFDATLTDSNGEIQPVVIDAINSFTSKGGLFSVSTGRTKQGFTACEQVPFNAPVMLGNGVMAYDYQNQSVIYAEGIGIEAKAFLNSLASAFPEISIEMYGTDFSTWCYHRDEISTPHFERQYIKWTDVDSFDDIPFPLVKIMLSVKSKGHDVDLWLKSNIPSSLKHIWDNGGFIEIISASAGKGKGLEKLAEKMRISPENVYCAGDGMNDIDMLKAAHISFSPSNSQQAVLESCDIIVRDNDHGSIAHVIEILETIYS